MANWRIKKGGERLRATEYYGMRDARRESRRRRGDSTLSFFIIESLLTRSRRLTFTSNGKRECVPRDQVSSLHVVYCSLFLHLN